MALQKYIYQENNKVTNTNAVISAAVAKSLKQSLVYPVKKKGTGNIIVVGNYTGAEDAKYQIKIKDNSLVNPFVSSPIFRGAGTGKISDIVAKGLEVQKITVLCTSTGIDTEYAKVEIEGLIYKAKIEGDAGNLIYISVDDSALVFTPTNYSLIESLPESSTGLEGQHLDFDTKAIAGNIIPTTAHRIAFGQDKINVYLQYKKYEDGEWKYYFIPIIKRAVNIGEKVYFVTGGKQVTITNGTITEIYNNIVSVADFYEAVKASALIEAESSAIDTARTLEGYACKEFTLKTNAYFLPAYPQSGSSEYAGNLDSIQITNDAKTEIIAIECIDNSFIGAEIWNVKGSAGGDMGQTQTGIFTNFGYIAFAVPQALPTNWDLPTDDWSHEWKPIDRPEGEVAPALCFDMCLGVASIPQTLYLKYKLKPADCTCPAVGFNDECLGLIPCDTGGGDAIMYIVPDLIFWTDVQQEIKREAWFIDLYAGVPGGDVNESSFITWASPYFDRFKTLAQRIMALTEDDPATLESIVTDYKAVVLSLIMSMPSFMSNKEVTYDTAAYSVVVDKVLLYERTYGLKKNNIVPQGTCYVEQNAVYYWEVRGSKSYLPAYTDTSYYATVIQNKIYVNTKEFAFLISFPCGGTVLEGDEIIVTIQGTAKSKTYQIGDIIYLPTIAEQNLYLTGGINGDDTYTFSINGEINSFANYLLDRDVPLKYSSSKLDLLITDGVVPFSVGDSFEFDIEGGHFIYRKDEGAWSSDIAINKELQTLAEGLRIGFEFGTSPSFEIDDTWNIICTQENKNSNMLQMNPMLKRKGTGDIIIDMGSVQASIDTLIIDLHTIPAGTIRFTASANSNFSSPIFNSIIAVSDLLCYLFTTPIVGARYFKISELPASTNTEIGFLFIGTFTELSLSGKVTPLRSYQMSRQGSKNPFSLLQSAKRGFNVLYDSFIMGNDYTKLDTMINYLKSNNDEPLYFIPNENYLTETLRCKVDTDKIEFDMPIDLNAPSDNRAYKLTLPLIGVED